MMADRVGVGTVSLLHSGVLVCVKTRLEEVSTRCRVFQNISEVVPDKAGQSLKFSDRFVCFAELAPPDAVRRKYSIRYKEVEYGRRA